MCSFQKTCPTLKINTSSEVGCFCESVQDILISPTNEYCKVSSTQSTLYVLTNWFCNAHNENEDVGFIQRLVQSQRPISYELTHSGSPCRIPSVAAYYHCNNNVGKYSRVRHWSRVACPAVYRVWTFGEQNNVTTSLTSVNPPFCATLNVV